MHRSAALSFLVLAVVTYLQDVKPILDRHCVECHTYGADLDVSGFPFVGAGTPAGMLDRMIARASATPASMPPGNRPKLTSAEVNVLKAWRDGGMKP